MDSTNADDATYADHAAHVPTDAVSTANVLSPGASTHDGRSNGGSNGCTNGWSNDCTNGWSNVWSNGCSNG
jgi:hypothetical protein